MKFENGPVEIKNTENGDIIVSMYTQFIFEDETPEEQELILKRFRQVYREELSRKTRSSMCLSDISYRGLTQEEVEQLFDKYIEEKKNVDSQKDELGQGNRTEIGQGKSEVFHEVQD